MKSRKGLGITGLMAGRRRLKEISVGIICFPLTIADKKIENAEPNFPLSTNH